MNGPVPGCKSTRNFKVMPRSVGATIPMQLRCDAPMKPSEFVSLRRHVLLLRSFVFRHGRYTISYPSSQRLMVNLRLDAREVFEQVVDRRNIRRTHNHVVFVNPNDTRNIDESVALGHDMTRVDQARIGGVGTFDPFTRRFGFIERDRNDGESKTFEFFVQCLPPGQVISAASPTGPDNEHFLLAADR